MNLDGSAVLSAPPERVWSLLTDPAVLARTIPGCQSLEAAGPDSYTMTVSAGVGAVRGTYAGKVRLSDKVSKYIPEWKSAAGEDVGAAATGSVDKGLDRETITIRHLLTHTSGLRSL